MNLRDDIELSVLAETGSLEAAERVRLALDMCFSMLADVFGVDLINFDVVTW